LLELARGRFAACWVAGLSRRTDRRCRTGSRPASYRGDGGRRRALLSDGDKAEGLLAVAVDHLSRTRVRTQLAHTHLFDGQWLRRSRRRLDARRELDTAFGLARTFL
jgi:hypothetical protein